VGTPAREHDVCAGRRVLVAIVALVAVRALILPVLLTDPLTTRANANLTGDVRRFHRIAESPGTPWRDFDVEYPPVMWAAIVVLDAPSLGWTTVNIVLSQFVCDIAIAAALAYAWGRRAALWYLALGATLVVFPFIYLRLDLLSVALAIWGFALVRRRRDVSGGALLAAACFAKLWPIVVLPMLVVQRRWRALAAVVVTGAIGLAAWVAAVGTTGLDQVLTFRGARGWEIESIGGMFVRAVTHDPVGVENGAWRIGISAVQWGKPLTAVMLATVAGLWALAWWRARDDVLVEAITPLAAIAAFLAFSTLLSPQFVYWLLPFAAIAAAGRRQVPALIVGAIVLLSNVFLYAIKEVIWGETWAVALLVVRNALIVALLAWCVVVLVRAARRSREDRPPREVHRSGRRAATMEACSPVPRPAPSPTPPAPTSSGTSTGG
jgi:hypothetical protein